MRPLKFLTDLPWWSGLPIFLVGTAAVLLVYPLGLIVALFGAWRFYKLMAPSDWKEPGFALIGLPLFFLTMLIPSRFSLEIPVLDLLNHLSTTITYGLRSALSLASAFIAFRSFH